MPAPNGTTPLTKRARDAKKRKLALLRGEAATLVPSAPAIEHIRMLRHKYGLSHHSIAALSGVSYPTICALDYENHPYHRAEVWDATARAILAVTFTPERLPDRACVDPTGTARRLRALMAIGWPAHELARRAGIDTRNLLNLCDQTSVSVATYKKIAALYNKLHMTPGPSHVGRDRARAKGWPSTFAWDEDSIDDPDARPYGVGRSRPASAAPELYAQGMSVAEIARELRIQEGSVDRAVKRARAREEGAA